MTERGGVRYGVLNLVFAGLYAWLGFGLAPSRSTAFRAALGVVVGLLALAGVALIARVRAARPLAIVASGVLFVFGAAVVVLLCAAAAYVRGVYAAIGEGLAILCLLIALAVAQLFLLLPIFELRHLLSSRPEV